MNKYYAALALVILLLLGFIIYQKQQIQTLRASIKDQQGQRDLGSGIIRGVSSSTTPDGVANAAKDQGINVGIIKDDASKSGSRITDVATTKTDSNGSKRTGIGSTRVDPAPPVSPSPSSKTSLEPPKDKFGYGSNTQYLSLNEEFGTVNVPIGEVGFSSWLEKPWSLEIKPRSYSSSVVIAENEERKKTVYSTFSIEVNGKKYALPIINSKLTYSEPESVLRWNPRLMAGLSVGVNTKPVSFEWGPNLGITIASYGKYKVSPDWFFGTVGFGYEITNDLMSFHLSPVLYKVSNHIPFTESLYLGPEIGIDLNGSILVSAGFKLAL